MSNTPHISTATCTCSGCCYEVVTVMAVQEEAS